jgi:hypothetical protein
VICGSALTCSAAGGVFAGVGDALLEEHVGGQIRLRTRSGEVAENAFNHDGAVTLVILRSLKNFAPLFGGNAVSAETGIEFEVNRRRAVRPGERRVGDSIQLGHRRHANGDAVCERLLKVLPRRVKPRENWRLNTRLAQRQGLLHVNNTQPVCAGVNRGARARNHAVSVGVGFDDNHEVFNTDDGLEVTHVAAQGAEVNLNFSKLWSDHAALPSATTNAMA